MEPEADRDPSMASSEGIAASFSVGSFLGYVLEEDLSSNQVGLQHRIPDLRHSNSRPPVFELPAFKELAC